MIIVTGGAGFIGSNLVKDLNQKGYDDILIVDDLSYGPKFKNIVDCKISDYLDKDDFLAKITNDTNFGRIEAIFHQGACTDTTEWDGNFMLRNNYAYSKTLLGYCLKNKIPFIYASSAAVYGANTIFSEHPNNEMPLNVYGYSKLLFDQHVRRILPKAKSQIVGFRYFNVYGPREQHKGTMASMVFHLNNQFKKNQALHLFEGSNGYGNGEQRRDFIYVGDIVDINLWFWQHPMLNGIYNVGTGQSQTFNDMANTIITWYGSGKIEYIPFPDNLRDHYQSFTQADISKLRKAGYDGTFHSIEEGIKSYLEWLNK
ncbi:MAG: ADP-L-glycero-D-manno-heptose-6-epimerase [Coxiella sp. DG_40]|nr:MAG: ADP-L-glycero-D-manno-heptose-6-epimerase [Coxiella sp. DG_40]